MNNRWRIAAAVTALATITPLAACQSPPAPSGQLVLADSQPLGEYNPLLGYGSLGVSPIYEGLLKPAADNDRTLPHLTPALAASAPERLSGREWKIRLRPNITFSDGTALDSADVVATYKAVASTTVAADIANQFAPIESVTADGPLAVTVTLSHNVSPDPYLLLGIVPSEKVQDKPAAEWDLNTHPVGTGPYRLDSLRPDQAVLTARDDYWNRTPTIRRVVYSYVPDDNTRSQMVATGQVDGANLPPRLAKANDGKNNVTMTTVSTTDWRGISLPASNPFTADQAARTAMNLGVDRADLIRDVLVGKGEPAFTPVAPVYGDAYNPDAKFPHDARAAATMLDRAGWVRGADGIRARGADRAAFTVLYDAKDTVRRDLGVAFADAMKDLGIEVTVTGSSWDDIETRISTDAVVLAGGEMPYSIDQQTYTTLHTRETGSSPFSNPGNFTAPGLDALLEQARSMPDSPTKNNLYREIQKRYVSAPGSVYLAFMHHTYTTRDTGMRHPNPILEPHIHGTSWGPWWDLDAWSAR